MSRFLSDQELIDKVVKYHDSLAFGTLQQRILKQVLRALAMAGHLKDEEDINDASTLVLLNLWNWLTAQGKDAEVNVQMAMDRMLYCFAKRRSLDQFRKKTGQGKVKRQPTVSTDEVMERHENDRSALPSKLITKSHENAVLMLIEYETELNRSRDHTTDKTEFL